MTSDERVRALLVLLELDDLRLYRRNVLLSDVHVSGINNGLPSFCLWVPWYLLQSRKAKLFDCLCDVGPTFILSLYVVGYRIDCLLVFLYLAEYFAFPMSKVWLSSPNTFVTNSFLVGCPAALMGRRNFLAPSILGSASNMFSLSFLVCSTGGVPSKGACVSDDRRGSTRPLINNVDATY